ncbi:MAG: hypothetical protein Q7S27_04130 [Nanoarchaeota archaeon]|nr:hypothetical protein [Nanoarchaeota archaeon]
MVKKSKTPKKKSKLGLYILIIVIILAVIGIIQYNASPSLAPYYSSSASPSPSGSPATLKASSNVLDSSKYQDPYSRFPRVKTFAGQACSCNINPQVQCNTNKLMIVNVIKQCQSAEICSGNCEFKVYCGTKSGDTYYIEYEIAGVDAPGSGGGSSTGTLWTSECRSAV